MVMLGDPQAYANWANDYFEMDVPLDAVAQIFAEQPLTERLAQQLNPELDWKDVLADAEEIGYPTVA